MILVHSSSRLWYSPGNLALCKQLVPRKGKPSHSVFSSLAQSANTFFFSYDPKQKTLIQTSGNSPNILGVKESEIAREGNLFLRYVHPRDRFTLLAKLEDALAGIAPYNVTYRWIRPDIREIRWIHCRATLKQVGDQPLFEGMLFEIAKTRSQTGELVHLLDALETVFILLDSDLTVVYNNGYAKTAGFNFGDIGFDFEKLVQGQPLERAFSNPVRWEFIATEIRSSFEQERRKWDPIECNSIPFQVETSICVDDSNEPIIVLHAQNISDILAAKLDLQVLSKATSYQVVSHGVMHNINNGLQALITEAANLIENRERAEDVQSRGEKIIRIAHNMAALTHELLALGGDTMSPIDLNVCLMNGLAKARELLPRGSNLEVSFSSATMCYGSAEQVSKLIENILKIIWSEFEPTTTLLRTSESLEESGRMLATIELKIPPSLALRHELIHGVCTRIQQLSPQITSVLDNHKITFSISFDKVLEQQKVLPLPTARDPLVLIVDDEPMVGDTICALLNQDKISATNVTSAARALDLLKQCPSIQLIVTDALMPDTRGDEFIRLLKKRYPHIITIGFSGSLTELKPLKSAGAQEVLLKPVDPIALRSILSKYLNLQNNAPRKVGNH